MPLESPLRRRAGGGPLPYDAVRRQDTTPSAPRPLRHPTASGDGGPASHRGPTRSGLLNAIRDAASDVGSTGRGVGDIDVADRELAEKPAAQDPGYHGTPARSVNGGAPRSASDVVDHEAPPAGSADADWSALRASGQASWSATDPTSSSVPASPGPSGPRPGTAAAGQPSPRSAAAGQPTSPAPPPALPTYGPTARSTVTAPAPPSAGYQSAEPPASPSPWPRSSGLAIPANLYASGTTGAAGWQQSAGGTVAGGFDPRQWHVGDDDIVPADGRKTARPKLWERLGR